MPLDELRHALEVRTRTVASRGTITVYLMLWPVSTRCLPYVLHTKNLLCFQTMGVPCFLGGMTRGLLGRNSPLHMRQKRREALRDADVVILAGTVCDFRLGYGQVLSRRSKVIAINRNKEQLYKVGIFPTS